MRDSSEKGGETRDGMGPPTFSILWITLCFITDSFDDKQINDCIWKFSLEEQVAFVR